MGTIVTGADLFVLTTAAFLILWGDKLSRKVRVRILAAETTAAGFSLVASVLEPSRELVPSAVVFVLVAMVLVRDARPAAGKATVK